MEAHSAYIGVVGHAFMKIKISILAILISGKLLGQVDENIFDFQKLTGFDSIVVSDVAGKVTAVYNFYENLLTKEKHFYNGRLSSFINYYHNGDLLIEQRHMKWTSYPENQEPIEKWGDTYYVTVTKTSGERIIETIKYESSGTDSILQEKIIPDYDSKGKLKLEMIHDHSTGLRNVFKSNSSEFGDSYNKTETTEKVKKYKHDLKKVTIDYTINNIVAGREVIELNAQGKPTKFLSLGKQNERLGEINLTYDSKGRVVQKKWEWDLGQDLWGNPVDFTGPINEKVIYNSLGHPIKVTLTEWKQKPKTLNYKYY
jgi:hypothetical protein